MKTPPPLLLVLLPTVASYTFFPAHYYNWTLSSSSEFLTFRADSMQTCGISCYHNVSCTGVSFSTADKVCVHYDGTSTAFRPPAQNTFFIERDSNECPLVEGKYSQHNPSTVDFRPNPSAVKAELAETQTPLSDGIEARRCADYQLPMIRAFAKRKGVHYYTTPEDVDELKQLNRTGEFALESSDPKYTGCVVGKSGLAALAEKCPGYESCVRALCAETMWPRGIDVYRFYSSESIDACSSTDRLIGYAPIVSDCCGSTNRMALMKRRDAPEGFLYTGDTAEMKTLMGKWDPEPGNRHLLFWAPVLA